MDWTDFDADDETTLALHVVTSGELVTVQICEASSQMETFFLPE